MLRSSFCSPVAYFRSKSRSLAKFRTEVLILPALRKLALYPKVSILARQTSDSRGKNINGQNNSGFLFSRQSISPSETMDEDDIRFVSVPRRIN